jgi:light-regulated signal transduction histidine kinase (bacteriophytochrome)
MASHPPAHRRPVPYRASDPEAEARRFAALAAHDLAEPLRTVSGFLELLQERYAGRLDEDADQFIGHAVDGVREMQRRLDDLVRWSRAGTEELARERVDLGLCARRALRTLAGAVQDTGAEVLIAPLPVVLGDRDRLTELLGHLLDNAIHSGRDGRPPVVRVQAEHGRGRWVISVADDGVGIDPADAEKALGLFTGLRAREGTDGGSGMGLALCRRIAERHRGEIWIEDAPGGGTVVRVALPQTGRRS